MSSIRPLITITILVVAFAFLYVKINESPMRPTPSESSAWDQAPDGVPPLAATVETSTTVDNAAPPWPATEAPADPVVDDSATEAAALTPAPSATGTLPAVAEVTETQPPAVPAMPEMPEPATTTQPSESPPTSIPVTAELPANIPTARYPDQPAVNENGTSVDVSASVTPPGSDTPGTPPIAPPATPESVSAVGAGAPVPASLPLASQPNPLRDAAKPSPVVDSLVPAASTANTAGVQAAPVELSFVESWPTIQTALDRGELARAHQLLSRWYDDPSLTPTDAERVESLLSQLAGTVVYSTDHQLAPAHVVKPGETLETIGKQYNVPWQLLAKINGITSSDQVRPGQQLKVVPGPFSATVDLTRNQMTIMVDGRYAGKFSVTPPPGVELPQGEWVVRDKPALPAAGSGDLGTNQPGTNYGGPQPTAAPVASSRQLVLVDARASAADNGTPVVIGSNPLLTPDYARVGTDGQVTKSSSPYLTVSSGDAEELADILSIGSRVVIRR